MTLVALVALLVVAGFVGWYHFCGVVPQPDFPTRRAASSTARSAPRATANPVLY